MAIDRRRFFDQVRVSLFRGRLTVPQVAGLTAILDCWRAHAPGERIDRLAYVLATAHHETGATMQPVRETFAESDEAAIAILERAFRAGRLAGVSKPYWLKDAEGKSWLGRGLVQLTHRANYEKMSVATGIDLVAEPERAMELDVAAKILVSGMLSGAFTGRRLAQYFDGSKADWTNARRIINGLDRAALVAGYGRAYRRALNGTASATG
ncbi:MAG: hypothetical protein QHC90_24040 [Shinella sp.]|nr:hypothetical protein [Shinella sp.]